MSMSKFIEARNKVTSFIIENCSDTEQEMPLHAALSEMTQEHARVISELEAAKAILRSAKEAK